ncbi:MAG: GNAT family N-acetyltransferase [Acidimicrobiales bacterium]
MEAARLAVAGDLDRLTTMWDQATVELTGHRGGELLAVTLAGPAAVEVSLDSYLHDPDRIMVVGTVDDYPLGFGAGRTDRSGVRPMGAVEAIYVEAEARHIGVGEAMLEVMLERWQSQGCLGADAPALPGNRAVKAFFETNGFIARLLVMHRPLTVEPGRESRVPPAVVASAAAVEGRPELCVGAVALDADRLLLVRRGRGAAQGRWSVPGGRVDWGETMAEAVVRELGEETGLEGVCEELLGWAERLDERDHFVIADFRVTVLDAGGLVAGDDAAEAMWAPLGDVAEMDLVEGLAEFLHDHGILPTFT